MSTWLADVWCSNLTPAVLDDVPDPTDEASTGWRCDRDALVSATCWCERTVVTITVGDMLDRQTGSCGHPTCAGTR